MNPELARGLAEGVVEALLVPKCRTTDKAEAHVTDGGGIEVSTTMVMRSDINPEQAPAITEALARRFALMLATLPPTTTMEAILPVMSQIVNEVLAEMREGT